MKREIVLFCHNGEQQEKQITGINTLLDEELQGFLHFVYIFTEETHVTNWEYRVDGKKQASGTFDKAVGGITGDTFDFTINEINMVGDNLIATLDSTKWYLKLGVA